MSNEQEIEPDEETLVKVFESFDKSQTGMISEEVFKHIMNGKDDVNEEDIREMLDEYYRLAKLKDLSTSRPEGLKEDEIPAPPPHANQQKRRASKAPVRRSSSSAAASEDVEERWINYRGKEGRPRGLC